MFFPNSVKEVEIKSGFIKGMKMYLNPSKERGYFFGTYEEEVQSILSRHVKSGMTAFNIGAHIGFFTLAISRLVGHDGKVVAFEPNPSVRKRLKENLKINGIENTVKVEEYAANDVDGSAKFSLALSGSQGRFSDLPYVKPGNVIEVPCISIDTYVTKSGVIPDFIFIDVEHAEGRVLKGMSHVMEKYRPLMIIEMHGKDSIKNAFDELRKHDYLISDCHGEIISSVNRVIYGNYFAAHVSYFKEKSPLDNVGSSLKGKQRKSTLMSKSNSPILLTSLPRSGATLLGAILNAHPNIAMFNEPWLFLMKQKYGTLRKRYNINLLVNNLCISTERFGYKIDIQLKKQILDDLFDRRGRLTYLEAFDIFLRNFSKSKGKVRWGIKQPSELYHIALLKKQFPDLKILHIVRDPRSTVTYRIGKTSLTPDDLTLILKYAKSWRAYMKFARESSVLNRTNYLEIKYEDLVSDPAIWVDRICDFIGEKYNAQMLNYYRLSNPYVPQDTEGNPSVSHKDVLLPIHTSGINEWRNLLSPAELEIVEMICGDEMVRRGYERLGTTGHLTKKQFLQTYITYYKQRVIRYMRTEIFEMMFHRLRKAYIFVSKS